MKKINLLAIISVVFAVLFGTSAFAQAQPAKAAAPAVKVYPKNAIASGDPAATYYQVVDQMLKQCNKDSFFNNMAQVGGSPQTISDIMENRVVGGLVQFDVLWLRANGQPAVRESIKTLIPLHSEQVHVVALTTNPKSGGFLGYGENVTVLKDVSALKGLPVAASGGSAYTAEAMNTLGNIGYKLNTNYDSSDAVLKSVEDGQNVAAVFVGGAPMKVIKALDRKKFRLLPFSKATTDSLKEVYAPSSVLYDNLSLTGVATVQVPAYFVVNNFKNKTMSAQLKSLRDCVKNDINDIAEAENAHGVWREIAKNFENDVKPRWDMYQPRP